jgi:hypothetical protein
VPICVAAPFCFTLPIPFLIQGEPPIRAVVWPGCVAVPGHGEGWLFGVSEAGLRG